MQDIGDQQQIAGESWAVAPGCTGHAGFERCRGFFASRDKHGNRHGNRPFCLLDLLRVEGRIMVGLDHCAELGDDELQRRERLVCGAGR